MRKLLLFFMVSLAVSVAASAQTTLTVNAGVTAQTIDGFGAANAFGCTTFDGSNECTLAAPWTTQECSLLYSRTSGIGLSLLRVKLEENGSFPYLTNMNCANAAGARIWLTPWSAPANLKTNGNIRNGGSLCNVGASAPCTGTSSEYQTWANQMANYIKTLQTTNGIPIYALSIQNEPDLSPSYEGMNYTPAQFDAFINPFMCNAMRTAGLGAVKLMLPEGSGGVGWDFSLGANTNADVNANSCVGIFANHGYNLTTPPALAPCNNTNTSSCTAGALALKGWQSVWETEDANLNTDSTGVSDALSWTFKVHNFLGKGLTAWHYWQAVNALADGVSDGTGQGLLNHTGAVAPGGTTGIPTRFYYFGQYSKFVRPGMVKISATSSSGTCAAGSGVCVDAFIGNDPGAQGIPAGMKAVIVAQAQAGTTQLLTVNLSALPAVTTVTPYLSDGASNTMTAKPSISVVSNSFTYSLCANCIVTFVSNVIPMALPTIPGWHKILNSEMNGTENTSPCPADSTNSPFLPVPVGYLSAPCSRIINAYSSAIADYARNRLIIWGGGHNDYGGNELYSLELNRAFQPFTSSTNPAIIRLSNPSIPNTNTYSRDCTPAFTVWNNTTNYAANQNVQFSGVYYSAVQASGPANGGAVTPGTNSNFWITLTCDVETLIDGRANARHTGLAAIVYSPNTDQLLSFGGSLNDHGSSPGWNVLSLDGSTPATLNAHGFIWGLNLSSVLSSCAPNCPSKWTALNTTSNNVIIQESAFDPNTGLFYVLPNTQGSAAGPYSFNPTTGVWTQIGNNSLFGNCPELAMDPEDHILLYAGCLIVPGDLCGVRYFSTAAGSSFATLTPPGCTTGPLPGCPDFTNWIATSDFSGTAPTWNNTTNYSIGAVVNYLGAYYTAQNASGPSNGGAITPGTNTTYWKTNVNSYWPGLVYDEVAHKFVFYGGANGGKTVVLDPVSWSCYTESYGTTQDVDQPLDIPLNTTVGGAWVSGHFARFPNLNMEVLINLGDHDAWTLKRRVGEIKIGPFATAQTNYVYSRGQVFVQGDIPNFPTAYVDGVQIAVTQFDVKNRWPDGSAKFGIVSFVIPSIAANHVATVNFDNQATGSNTGFLLKTDMLSAPYNFDAQIQLTGPTSPAAISARAILNAATTIADCTGSDPDGTLTASGPACYWLKGPVVTSVILEDRSATRTYDVNTDGLTGNPLHPRFSVDFYPQGNMVRVGYNLENEWASATSTLSARPQTINSVAFTGGNTSPITVYSQAVGWTSQPSTSIRHTYCINGTGAGQQNFCGTPVHIDMNQAYLQATKFFPNYDTIVLGPGLINGSNGMIGPNTSAIFGGCTGCYGGSGGIGGYNANLNSGGWAPTHGTMDGWEIAWLISQSDNGTSGTSACAANGTNGDLLSLMLCNSDFGGDLPFWWREADHNAGHGQTFDNSGVIGNVETRGRMVSLNARQQVNFIDPTQQSSFCTASSPAPLDWIQLPGNTYPLGKWTGFAPSDVSTHWPDIAYPSYIVTGEYDYYTMVLQQGDEGMWGPGCNGFTGANFSYLRKGSTGYVNMGQERGANWALRQMGWAAFVAVNGSPEKAYLEDKLYNNLALLEGMHDIPLDVTTVGGVTGSRTAAWNFGNAAQNLATNPGRHDNTPGQSPLQFWWNIAAYTNNKPICGWSGAGSTAGCTNIQNPNNLPNTGMADSNFQAGYSVYTLGLLTDLGYVSQAPLQFVMKNYIHRMLDPTANQFAIGDYVFPTQGPSGWATDYTNQRTFIYTPDAAVDASQYTGAHCATAGIDGFDEPYALMTPAALSYGVTYGMTDGTYTATAAYAAARAMMATCVNGTGGATFSFATGSPKWDLVPRGQISGGNTAAVSGGVVAPTFSPIAGSYGATQNVTIATITAGATICWTADGSNPTTNGGGTCTHGTTYVGPVAVSVSETLKAIGTLAGSTDSAIASAAYTIGGTPAVSLNVTSLSFGYLPINTTGLPQTVTLTNTGTATLIISGIGVTGANSANFTVTANLCGTSLPQGNSCNVSVAFAPISPIPLTANLTFQTNAPSNPNNVSLSGNGSVGAFFGNGGFIGSGSVLIHP